MTRSVGQLVVSIDFEMAWGLVHRNGQATYDIEDERAWLGEVLDLFDRYRVPATWATVGHLLLESCDASETKHPEIEHPSYDWFEGDWFDACPCTNVEDAPRWYAPDVVADIVARPAGHEMGCHGFSHAIIGDPSYTASAFASELEASAAAARRHDVELRSFVYPRNTIGHVDELVDAGYVAYRGARDDPFASLGPLGRVARLLDKVAPSKRSIVRPVREGAIWNMPATCLFTVEQRKNPELWTRQMRRRMRHAARHGGMFHLWFHPHNIVLGGRASLVALESLLAQAAELRDEGVMETLTMSELAAELDDPDARVAA